MNIASYITPGKRCHLVGIGGISMRALGEVLLGMGVTVTGSDMSESEAVAQLRNLGIPVAHGHLAESVHGADCVIRTAAVHDNNPEIAEAHRLGIPVFGRAQTWGSLMKKYKNALCIAGTHGKTTTTSMVTEILMTASADPTVMIGGILPSIGSSFRVGKSDTIVLESCEYCDSFLNFYPTVATILNIEADHLDYFSGIDSIISSFNRFASLVPSDGVIIANHDDKNALKAIENIDRKKITFGLSKAANIYAKGFANDKYNEFDVYQGETLLFHLSLSVSGIHNVSNALAATASCLMLGIPAHFIKDGLEGFGGVKRRMEFKGRYLDADIYDDYAHHPSELKATLTSAKAMGYNRVVCVFQPHTYSRTKALFNDFVDALSIPDVVLLSDIYAARETDSYGISSSDLAKAIPGAIYCGSISNTANRLRNIIQPGDLILTVGAGDIYRVGEIILG